MDTVLCHASAYEILNSLRVATARRAERDPSLRLKPVALERSRGTYANLEMPSAETIARLLDPARFGCVGNAKNTGDLDPAAIGLPGLSEPVHVLVGRNVARRFTNQRIPHSISTALAPGSLVRIAQGLLVSSPEHLFLQMVRVFDELELIWLGCELCATYARPPRLPGAIEAAYPLTSKTTLASYLEKANELGMPGVTSARKALRFVLEGAASPREIAMPLTMCLPCSKGGRNVPQPRLNHRIEADRRFATMSGRTHFSCDCCWPERKLVVEYDSDCFHLDGKQRARDNDRQAALEQMGYRVIPVSTEQFEQLALSDDAFRRVASHLGVHTRDGRHGYDWQARRWNLRKRLLRLSNTGLDWSPSRKRMPTGTRAEACAV